MVARWFEIFVLKMTAKRNRQIANNLNLSQFSLFFVNGVINHIYIDMLTYHNSKIKLSFPLWFPAYKFMEQNLEINYSTSLSSEMPEVNMNPKPNNSVLDTRV